MNKSSTPQLDHSPTKHPNTRTNQSYHQSIIQQMNPELVTPSPNRVMEAFQHNEEGDRNYSIASLIQDVECNYDDYEMLTHEITSWIRGNAQDTSEVIPQVVDDFNVIEDDEMNKIRFEEESAKNDLEETMVQEHDMIQKKLKTIMGENWEQDKIHPTLNEIYSIYFGPKSLVTKVFLAKLSCSYEDFLKLLSTIAVMQAYRLSATLLYDKNGIINKHKLEVSKMKMNIIPT